MWSVSQFSWIGLGRGRFWLGTNTWFTPAEHSRRRTSFTSCSTASYFLCKERFRWWRRRRRAEGKGGSRSLFLPSTPPPCPSSTRLIVHYKYLLVLFVSQQLFCSFVRLFRAYKNLSIQANGETLQSSWSFQVFFFLFFLVIIPPSLLWLHLALFTTAQ